MQLSSPQVAWALSALGRLFSLPISDVLVGKLARQARTPEGFVALAEQAGLKLAKCPQLDPRTWTLDAPVIAFAKSAAAGSSNTSIKLFVQRQNFKLVFVEPDQPQPQEIEANDLPSAAFEAAYRVQPAPQTVTDPDAQVHHQSHFGFAWFLPELLKHKAIWREIVLASLVIQLLGLAMPLITQAVIDKVIVHQTQSTLAVLATAMALFMLFTVGLTWVRQYLILHTGNRVDAALGGAVFAHLLRLPAMYFEHRPTGVIAARLHGVETVREFIASAAVTLVLDLPFLMIFVAVMFWYSVKLTLIVLGILGLVVGLSLVIAPMFQRQLNEQFLLGARNQAFVTEYVAGMETVKSLQLEPQLHGQYADYLASYLEASFDTKQLANTYNTCATALEQLMSLLVLAIGAWTVMTSDMRADSAFTIGMLVAFQMFSQRLSQPMLRLVGLWQQFQQARLAVVRLGDLMNAPTEPYTLRSQRPLDGPGEVRIERLAFRYAPDLPLLYEDLSLDVRAGSLIALMGPSGCGKSTLAKLLQGFYQPTAGVLRIDGTDIRHLAANELRHYFGVVPQETVLFSGTIWHNLTLANPNAASEEVTAACRMAEVHGVIEALPHGYQTEVGERGAGLSGGQKQRLAIARALLKRPRILIFDEAVANLDAQTAESFARTINALRGRVTILFITHAIPRSLKVDQIVRLGAMPEVLTAVAPTPPLKANSASVAAPIATQEVGA